MLLSRAMDDQFTKLQRLGRVRLYGPVHGQEATVVGSAMALDPARDWMVPASREQPAMVHHGWPLERLVAAYLGRPDHASIPPGVRLLPRQQAIGAQLPHAAGLAWAQKLRGEQGVVMVYCGDGASSEGDFHEACNLAGVMRVPLVVVLINNQYAISTPLARQTAAEHLALRALGYGLTGVSVDGNDLFAVHAAAREAVERALEGGGPTLLECRTYRLGFHNTTDNPRAYRADAEVEEALRRDPLARLRRYVVDAGIMSDEAFLAASEEAAGAVRDAHRRVADLPGPGPEAIFDDVYEELPPRVQAQRDDVLGG
jgi:pyruvate dehydrogenase E1 component alpha subunit